MDKIEKLLDPALRKMGIRTQVREAQLQEYLAEIVGPSLAPLCTVISLHRGALLIATAHTALSHQLHMDSVRVITELNERVGTDAVKRLAFTAKRQ